MSAWLLRVPLIDRIGSAKKNTIRFSESSNDFIGSMDAFVTRLSKPKSELGNNTRASPPVGPDTERPSKRVKRKEARELESDQTDSSSPEKDYEPKVADEGCSDDQEQYGRHQMTEFESALPPTQIDKEAIEEYEAMKSSQMSAADNDGTSEKTQPLWVKGKSSIYVDAFNLALDTVLDEESHLFDEKEMDVFRQWKELDYEAQYL